MSKEGLVFVRRTFYSSNGGEVVYPRHFSCFSFFTTFFSVSFFTTVRLVCSAKYVGCEMYLFWRIIQMDQPPKGLVARTVAALGKLSGTYNPENPLVNKAIFVWGRTRATSSLCGRRRRFVTASNCTTQRRVRGIVGHGALDNAKKGTKGRRISERSPRCTLGSSLQDRE